MAITQAFCNSAKVALLDGEIDFSSDTTRTYKLALYTNAATLDKNTTAYSPAGESGGVGYTAAGEDLTIALPPELDADTAILDFEDVTWPNASITARGALIYDAATGATVAVLDFGQDVTSTNGNFEVQFPVPAAASAILRIG